MPTSIGTITTVCTRYALTTPHSRKAIVVSVWFITCSPVSVYCPQLGSVYYVVARLPFVATNRCYQFHPLFREWYMPSGGANAVFCSTVPVVKPAAFVA